MSKYPRIQRAALNAGIQIVMLVCIGLDVTKRLQANHVDPKDHAWIIIALLVTWIIGVCHPVIGSPQKPSNQEHHNGP